MKKIIILICGLSLAVVGCTSNENRTGETYDSNNMVPPGNSSQNDSLRLMTDTSGMYNDSLNRMNGDSPMRNK